MPHAASAMAGIPPAGLLALSGSLGAGAPSHIPGLPSLGAPPGVPGPTTPSLGPGSGSLKNHRADDNIKRSNSGEFKLVF